MPTTQLRQNQFAISNNTKVPGQATCIFTDAGGGRIKMELSMVFTPQQSNSGAAPVNILDSITSCAVLSFDGINVATSSPNIQVDAVADNNVTLMIDRFVISGLKGKLGESLDQQ